MTDETVNSDAPDSPSASGRGVRVGKARIKVLLVSPCFGVFGGIEAFVLALAEFLSRDARCEVRTVFKLTGNCQPQANLLSATEGYDFKIVFLKRRSWQLMREIVWADVVHCQNPCPDVVLFAKGMNKKIVLTVHNRRMPQRNYYSRLWALSSRLADRRWFNSNFVLNTWQPNAADARSEVIPTVSRLPSGMIPHQDRRGFVFAGRWIANKGIDTLVQAYGQARLDRKEWPLLLLGDGPLRPMIKGLVDSLGLGGVTMPGFVSEETKADAIRHARWLVAPPNTKEDLGLTPIEARSVGVPSIVTNDGGLPEAAGTSALVCEAGDTEALALLLERAAAMPEAEYAARASACHASLTAFLRPLSFYPAAYAEVLGEA